MLVEKEPVKVPGNSYLLCLISTITGHLRTRFADIFLEDVLSKNTIFQLEDALEEKLEGGIGGIGKESRGMKSAIAG